MFNCKMSFIKDVNVDSLSGPITADLSGADIVVQGEEPVEEHTQPNQGSWQQPASVEPLKIPTFNFHLKIFLINYKEKIHKCTKWKFPIMFALLLEKLLFKLILLKSFTGK